MLMGGPRDGSVSWDSHRGCLKKLAGAQGVTQGLGMNLGIPFKTNHTKNGL